MDIVDDGGFDDVCLYRYKREYDSIDGDYVQWYCPDTDDAIDNHSDRKLPGMDRFVLCSEWIQIQTDVGSVQTGRMLAYTLFQILNSSVAVTQKLVKAL